MVHLTLQKMVYLLQWEEIELEEPFEDMGATQLVKEVSQRTGEYGGKMVQPQRRCDAKVCIGEVGFQVESTMDSKSSRS